MSLWQWIATWFGQRPPKPPPKPPPIPEPIVALFDCLNEARADHGLELFLANARLDGLALSWAQTMEANGTLAHGDSAGRIARAFPNRASAENIAWGQRDSEAVVSSWLDSPGHRSNMLNPQYTTAGCGRSGDYWVADFLS